MTFLLLCICVLLVLFSLYCARLLVAVRRLEARLEPPRKTARYRTDALNTATLRRCTCERERWYNK